MIPQSQRNTNQREEDARDDVIPLPTHRILKPRGKGFRLIETGEDRRRRESHRREEWEVRGVVARHERSHIDRKEPNKRGGEKPNLDGIFTP